MRTLKTAALVCFVVCLVIFSGCSSSSSKQPISVSVAPQTAYIGSAQAMQFTVTVENDTSGATWSVAGSGNGTIDSQGNFTAPTVTQNTSVTVTATSVKDPTKSASATVVIVAPGVVDTTANAQVAQYTITVPDGL